MANVNRQTVSDGAAIQWSSASGGGDSLQGGDDVTLFVWNGDVSSHSITLVTTATLAGFAVADNTIAVGAGEIRKVRLARNLYCDANGRVAATYTAVTSVKVACVAGL